ncbi:unnamed protein product [Cuscuta epithymum]|uniref:HSP20-like chaperones superfamily protein n=1 Tax=Cuscuta epithymum TaxID=186058 RepID=A0AAV0GFL5_9ASTE|nr:unnamed protein product [Cuscuta epithymum]
MGGDILLTALSMENHCHPSTLLSMDSSASSSHDDLELERNRQVIITRPPDINLPLSSEQSPPPHPLWNLEQQQCEILDVGLGTQTYETTESFLNVVPKMVVGRKCAKRVDSIWGAWFFFSFYFRPVLSEKSKAKVVRDSNGVSGFDKSDLQLDVFMVQHDMENMYMWVFKERPENALGKMQLRSYMNGHSRQGERPFPFSVDKGFVRSHRMQRKHYRGLSNPQCVHGVEVVHSPNLMAVLDEEDQKRWVELTGRDLDFTIPPEASDYGSWRNLPNTEFELERPHQQPPPNTKSKKLLQSLRCSSGLNLATATQPPLNHTNGDAMDISPDSSSKRKKDMLLPQDVCYLPESSDQIMVADLEVGHHPHWLDEFSGVMRGVYGPVTGAKSIYEDCEGYLVLISLPFVDPQKVKVSWRNTPTHGIVKVTCTSVSCMPFIKRQKRIFKLADLSAEHCPPGEFVREIPLSTRIPEDANIEAYFDASGTVLEILVPKLQEGSEEHEVRVCLHPHLGGNDLILN